MERENFVDGIPGTERLVDIERNEFGGDFKNEQGEIVLIPTPTKCGSDPLGWSRYKKYWHLLVVSTYACTFAFGENNLGAAWTDVANDIGVTMDNMNGGSALNWLLLGFVNLLWIPTAMKFGRRPVLIATTVLAMCAMIWIGKCDGTAQWYLALTLSGFGYAGYEAMIQITIFDCFFVHERGRALAFYLFSQQIGAVIGLVSGGKMDDGMGWRWSQFLVAIIEAGLILTFIFAYDETLFPRFLFERAEHTKYVKAVKSNQIELLDSGKISKEEENEKNGLSFNVDETNESESYEFPDVDEFPAKTWKQNVTKWWTYFPQDGTTYLQYLRRPFILLTFPNILFAGFNFGFGATGGMLFFSTVAEILMDAPYNFSATTTGIICLGSFVGCFVGWFFGSLSDYCVIYFSKRNGGIKEPEMRLYAMVFPFCFACIGFMMYGWGAQNEKSWPYISVGLGFMSAQQVSSMSIVTSYGMDCFRGISCELVVVLAIFSSCINFASSFSCQQFLESCGYGWLFFTWGMLVMTVNASSVFAIIFGKRWRKNSAEKYFKFVEEGKQH